MSRAEMSRLVEEAGFIFRGKVTKPTRDIEGATARQTLTAQVEEILLSTDVLRGLVGRDVTVVTEHAAAMEDEGSFLFFTSCVVLGDNIVVREVGRIKPSRDAGHEV